jgi:hypothetical protein
VANDPPHVPAPPKTAEPPVRLAETIKALNHFGVVHPGIVNVGLTTTASGAWAAIVRVHRGTATPISDVDHQFTGFPVIYEIAPDQPAVARPAFPDRGE